MNPIIENNNANVTFSYTSILIADLQALFYPKFELTKSAIDYIVIHLEYLLISSVDPRINTCRAENLHVGFKFLYGAIDSITRKSFNEFCLFCVFNIIKS